MSDINVLVQRTVAAALWAGGGYVFFRWLLAPLLPFLLALGLAAMAEPLVQRFRRRLHVRRSFAAAAVTTGVLVVAGGTLLLLAARLGMELAGWMDRIPETAARFPQLWNSLLDRVEGWYAACPQAVRTALDHAAGHLAQAAPTLAGRAGSWLMETASLLVGKLPDLGLFLITTVLAVYFTSLGYPEILAFLKRQLPAAWQGRCRAAAQCFRSTMLKWLRSEAILLTVTFVILLAGFLLMGMDYALLAAAFTALVDALPVLGTGTVLIPWAAALLLLGDTGRGLGLLALYAVATLSHSLLEPRLLAGQAGLPPLSALLAMYVGFRLMGIGGMLLMPILLLLVKQLSDAGVVRLWR